MKIQKFKTVRGVLFGVKRLYADKNRWVKGAWTSTSPVDGLPCFCLSQAIDECSAGIGVRNDTRRAVQKMISKLTSRHHSSIISFNDAPRRTIEAIRNVVAKAYKAA